MKMAAEGVINDKTGAGEVSYTLLTTVIDDKATANLTSGQNFVDSGTVSAK